MRKNGVNKVFSLTSYFIEFGKGINSGHQIIQNSFIDCNVNESIFLKLFKMPIHHPVIL